MLAVSIHIPYGETFIFTSSISAQTVTDSLVAYYPFNGNSNDESGNTNHGTVNGASLTPDRFGNANTAYNFDGTDDYINVTRTTALEPSNITVGIWIKPDVNLKAGGETIPHFISKQSASAPTQGYNLFYENRSSEGTADGSIRSAFGSGLSEYHLLHYTTTLDSGKWVHIAVTHDGTAQKLYMNGIEVASGSTTFTLSHATSTDLTIGQISGSTDYFTKGSIDDIRIYNRALTASEISSLYSIGGWDKTPPETPTNLTATSGNTQITLKWSKNTETDMAKYIIYGGTSASPTTKVDSTTSVSDTSKTITGLTNNTTYYHRISAVDSAGNESNYTSDVNAVPRSTTISPFLSSASQISSDGKVKSFQKISDTQGNFTATLDNSDFFGIDVATIGDLDDDGINDLAIGAYYDDDGGSGRGAVYVLFMKTDGTVKSYQKISDTEGSFTATLDDTDLFGVSVTAMGDLNGDGIIDLAVGAIFDDDGGSNHGAVYVLFMNTDGTVKSFQKISDTVGSFTATLGSSDIFGVSVSALGDLDGDGVTDLAVGAPEDDDGGEGRGAMYVLFLKTDGTVKSYQKISNTEGSFTATLNTGDRFGASVTAMGDLDGDGVTDLVVGAQEDDDGGQSRSAVYVLFMQTNGTVKSFQKISDTAGNFTATLDDGDRFGISTATLGDLDGDGVIDLAVGADNDDDGGTNRGAVYVLFLKDALPATPTGLTATAGNTQITLKWSKNSESDFAKYIIYGGTSASPTAKVDSATSVSDTTKTISDLTNGTTYYYRITAVDSAGNESGYSDEVNTTPSVPETGTWATKASMPTARGFSLATGVVNGVLYAVGGYDGTSVVATVEAYDPVTNTWSTKTSMPTARDRLAVGVIDGILYAVGGYSGSGNSGFSTIEAYNPATDTWTTKTSMPTVRWHPSIGVVNGILYVVGGWNGSTTLSTVEAYDPKTDQWTTKASMPTARYTPGVGVINGILYAVGGASANTGAYFSTLEAYDPTTDTWTTKASITAVRKNLAAGVENGILYAVGGSVTGEIVVGTVEAYDPVNDTWATDASMPTARCCLGASVVNGILYAVGGTDSSKVLATVEAFTPALDIFSPTSTISSTENSPTSVSPIPITITFSEDVTGFESNEVTLSNGTLSNFTGSGATYTFDITPSGDTTVTVNIDDNVAQDAAGNWNTAATQFSITYNGTAPTVSISSSITSPTNTTPIPIQVTFSENVAGFDSTDITVSNGTVNSFTGSEASYTFNISPTQDTTVTIDIKSNSAQDDAGNGNTAATQFSIIYDGTAPAISTLSPEDNALSAATNANIVITFSEAVVIDTGKMFVKKKSDDSIAETIDVKSDSVTLSEKSATVDITDMSGSTEYFVFIDSTAFKDEAGNYFSGIYSDTTWNFTTADSSAATVVISSSVTSPTNSKSIPITVTFSESMAGFDSTDVTVVNGAISSFSGSGAIYTFNIAPVKDGDVTIDIAENAALNDAGSGNASATQFSITFDGTSPKLVFSSSAAPATNNAKIPFSVSIDETVTGYESGDIIMSTGSLSDFSEAGLTSTFNITVSSGDTITVEVKDSAFMDLAGNYNQSTQFSIIYDTASPIAGSVNDGDGVDRDYQSSNTTLTANWSGFNDLLSGVSSYEWAIGTTNAGVDVVGWTNIGPDTVAENISLSLVNDQKYYIFVRAKDNAGNLSLAAISDGVAVDLSNPTIGIPWDGTELTDLDWQLPTTVTIQWNETVDEGLAYYEYSIGKAAGGTDIVPWTNNDVDTSATLENLSLSEGVNYYTNVRAFDLAGNESNIASSDGFKVDGTPPLVGSIAINDLVEEQYLGSTSEINIQPSGFSDESSGLKSFRVGIGTETSNYDLVSSMELDSNDVLILENLTLPDYQIGYVNVEAVDFVGNVSAIVSSQQFMVYETFLGDFNGDKNIDAIDIANLAVKWPNVDFGPVKGEAPYFIPDFDGVANLRDLMVFTRMWHWSRKNSGSARILAKTGTEPKIAQSGKLLSITLPENTAAGNIEISYSLVKMSIENQSESVGEKAISLFYNDETLGIADLAFADLTGKSIGNKQFSIMVKGKNNVSFNMTYVLFDSKGMLAGEGTVPVDFIPIPDDFALHHNYPNPFNPVTTIMYDLPEDSEVHLTVYDLLGRPVRTLVNSTEKAGYKVITWDARNDRGHLSAAGIYFYQLQTTDFVKTRKMVLVK